MPALRVLWIEDKLNHIKRYVELLEDRGMNAEVVETGEAVFDTMETAKQKRRRYGVILLDIMMPKGEGDRIDSSIRPELMGEEVLRQMRRRRIRTPVIVITAVADDQLTNRIRQDYPFVVDVLKKPIKMAELDGAISRALCTPKGEKEGR